MSSYKYDIAISYASEQETFVSNVCSILKEEGLNVFFAPQSKGEIIAQDMVKRFYKIYRYECNFVAAFVSPDYLNKNYCMQEANTALLREPLNGFSRLIPVYLYGAKLQKLNPNINYIHSDGKNYVSVADDILHILRMSKTEKCNSTIESKDSQSTSINKSIVIHGDVNGNITQN